jgi:hypothetical protein
MNERVGPKRESPKEDCGAWPLRMSRATPNQTLCGAADVVDVPSGAFFLSSNPEDVPSVAVFPSTGAPFETSWYHVPVGRRGGRTIGRSSRVGRGSTVRCVLVSDGVIGRREMGQSRMLASSALTLLWRSGMSRGRTSATSSRRVLVVESTRAITSSRQVLWASDVPESWSSKPLWVRSRASSAARVEV